METPKLGVASILWLNFYLTKLQVLGAGPTQSLINCGRPAPSTQYPRFLLNKCSAIKHLQVWPLFDKCAMVAKKELKYAGTFGLAQILMGTVFVDRSSEKGRNAVNEAGKKAKENGSSLCSH